MIATDRSGVEVSRLDRELHVVLSPRVLERTNPVTEKLGTYIIGGPLMRCGGAFGKLHRVSQPAAALNRRSFRATGYPTG